MTPEANCTVCGGALDAEHQARCIYCGGLFHQPWRADAAVPTCGRIFAHADAQGLVFACLRCAQAMLEHGQD